MPSVVVLVEGASDAAVVSVLAQRRGLALASAGIRILPTGGAMGAGRTLRALDARPDRVLALVDEHESPHVERALSGPEDALFVCRRDLEDVLIRGLGTDRVIELLETTRDLRPFRTLQAQPEHRGSPADRQLHRFIAAGSGRKERIDAALAADFAPRREPEPLRALLDALEGLLADQG